MDGHGGMRGMRWRSGALTVSQGQAQICLGVKVRGQPLWFVLTYFETGTLVCYCISQAT